MELVEVIRRRKSVRKFKDDVVPDLTNIIKLAQTGPSAGAIRGWEIIVTSEQVGPYTAPCYIVLGTVQEKYIGRYGIRGRDLYALQDVAVVASYLQLLLVDNGLASCWVGAFNEQRVRRVVGASARPVILLAVGYAND